MRIHCLGVFVLESARAEYVLRPSGRVRLFALLVLNSNKPVSVSRLMTELWNDRPPDNAKNAFYAQMVRLRRDLDIWTQGEDPVLNTQFPGYRLNLGTASLDVLDFSSLAGQARRLRHENPRQAVAVGYKALAQWNGSAFAGMTLGPVGESIKIRLSEDRFSLLLDIIDARLEMGEHNEMLPELHELIQRYRFHERLYAQLMTALYRSGRLSEALRTYELARSRFVQDLGVRPSPVLEQLFTQMLRHDPAVARPFVASPAYSLP